MSQSYDLKKLQNCILYIAKEIDRICKENSIEYSISAGTMLGAVRHNGFIPWDDDLDLLMTRSNYDKFKKVCENELGNEFEMIDWKNDNYYSNAFMKIMLKDTLTVQPGFENAKYKQGIFVDVFPVDNIPDSKIKQFIQNLFTRACLIMLQCKDGAVRKRLNGVFDGAEFWLLRKLSYMLTHKKLVDLCEKEMTRYNGKSCSKASMISFSYKKYAFPVNYYTGCIYAVFEDCKFMMLSEYKEILRQVYGDYMILPPENERESHSFVFVDFGKY